MNHNLEIEQIGNTISCVSGVIHKLLESCDIDDTKSITNTIDSVCYMTDFIEIQAKKLIALQYHQEGKGVTENVK